MKGGGSTLLRVSGGEAELHGPHGGSENVFEAAPRRRDVSKQTAAFANRCGAVSSCTFASGVGL